MFENEEADSLIVFEEDWLFFDLVLKGTADNLILLFELRSLSKLVESWRSRLLWSKFIESNIIWGCLMKVEFYV